MTPSTTIGVASTPRAVRLLMSSDQARPSWPMLAGVILVERAEALLGVGAAVAQPVARLLVRGNDALGVDIGGDSHPCAGQQRRCECGKAQIAQDLPSCVPPVRASFHAGALMDVQSPTAKRRPWRSRHLLEGCCGRHESEGGIAPAFAQRSCYASWSPIGSWRMRLPVAAKMALHSAGANGGTPGSPTPLGGTSMPCCTMCVRVSVGDSSMRTSW